MIMMRMVARFSIKDPSGIAGAVLGGIVGALNGYFIGGTVWYYLDELDYPVQGYNWFVTQFSESALKLKEKARIKYQEEHLVAHPPTIIMNTEPDPTCGNSTRLSISISSGLIFGSLTMTSSPAAKIVRDLSAAIRATGTVISPWGEVTRAQSPSSNACSNQIFCGMYNGLRP